MITRAQAAFLRFHDGYGTTFDAWQSYFLDTLISLYDYRYRYQRFSWGGTTSGGIGANGVSLSVANTPLVRMLMERAMAGAYLVDFEVHQFDDTLVQSQFEALNGSSLVTSCLFEVVGATGSMTELTIRLGASLGSIGAQFPPRSANTRLIGIPCVL